MKPDPRKHGPAPGGRLKSDAAAAHAAAAPAAGRPPADDDVELLAYVDAATEGNISATEPDEHQVVRDLDELAAKAERADEYLELAQRTRADFENYRKRATREVAAAQDRGAAKLAKELLPAIDNLERAIQAASGGAAPVGSAAPVASAEVPGAERAQDADGSAGDSQLVSGIKLVHADLLGALARAGIEVFSPTGEQFDPAYHEAVAQAPVDGAQSGSVVEVYQPGYRIGETVLRPARVLVAS